MRAGAIESYWYRLAPLHLLLWPVSLLFGLLSCLRRILYQCGCLRRFKLPVPVIVVGNISVGGTGKTPFTLWLVRRLLDAGWHPAIISRGYGSAAQGARAVSAQQSAQQVGDEPLLMAQRGVCPVWVGRDRSAVAQAVLAAHPECDVIVSDDGLQHYRLQRQVEIVLVDGERRFGNGFLLPAGPLREPVCRLNSVDFVVINGAMAEEKQFSMRLVGAQFYNLLNINNSLHSSELSGKKIHAIAGIGNPHRFFKHLKNLGIQAQAHAFADHYAFSATDIAFADADAILMTEKDAVKCSPFATDRCWVLRVDAEIDSPLAQLIIEKLT